MSDVPSAKARQRIRLYFQDRAKKERAMHTDCHLSNCEQCDLERAVIKAAEAWYQTAGNGAPVNLDEVLLHQAVEALQAAKEVE